MHRVDRWEDLGGGHTAVTTVAFLDPCYAAAREVPMFLHGRRSSPAPTSPQQQDVSQASAGPSHPGPSLGQVAGGLYGGFVTRNVIQQILARNGHTPVDMTSRMGALMGTRGFAPGTVGYGAHGGISVIQALLGGVGQSNIGTLFNSPHAQHLMRQPIRSPANRELANLEHGLWRQRLGGLGALGASTLGERFGGALGSAFVPSSRAMLQTGFAALRANPVAAVLLGLGGYTAYQRLRETD